jgi:hypothetical protein
VAIEFGSAQDVRAYPGRVANAPGDIVDRTPVFRRLWTVVNGKEQALAPRAGFEPATNRLTVVSIAFRRNRSQFHAQAKPLKSDTL